MQISVFVTDLSMRMYSNIDRPVRIDELRDLFIRIFYWQYAGRQVRDLNFKVKDSVCRLGFRFTVQATGIRD